MNVPKKVVGVEQVGDEQVTHEVIDFRPIISIGLWTFLTVIVLIVAEVTK